MVSCVIKHLNLVDALQSLINFQYQEEHAEEYDLLCKIMGETFKKLNAMERQLQVRRRWGTKNPVSCTAKEDGDALRVKISVSQKSRCGPSAIFVCA